MCCFRLTKYVEYGENCFTGERDEKATVKTKKGHFHHIKKRNLAVK